jgi:tetratricopeptide (TPR) repeat protein
MPACFSSGGCGDLGECPIIQIHDNCGWTSAMPDSLRANLESLRQLVASDPSRADARYLLGAEWAAAGRYDMAVAEMTSAVALDPNMHTAHLQLGLLHLSSGRAKEAVAAWQPLEALDDASPIKKFKRGLEALIRDDFAECVLMLEAGIRANHGNAPLNRDMALVIDRVRPKASVPRSDSPTAEDPPVHTDFSLYDPKKS